MKANCIVCGNEFSERKGKIYCSDSCKTKAYELRKAGKEISGENKKPKGVIVSFKVAEYEEISKMFKSFSISFVSYCFFRKNLPNNLSIERIYLVLHSYWNNDLIDDNGNIINESSALFKSFEEFKLNFFSGIFEIN